jgi:hypothetical protein
MSKSKQNSTELGIKLTKRGLFRIAPDGSRDRIAPWIKVEARVIEGDDEGAPITSSSVRTTKSKRLGQWSVLIRFRDHDDEVREIIVLESVLGGPKIIDHLLDAGYRLPAPGDNRKLVLGYLRDASPARRATVVRQCGWQGNNFVISGKVYGPDGRRLIYAPRLNERSRQCWERRGSLAEWKDAIASPAETSTRLIVALCLAASAPLLKLTNGKGGIVHFGGRSSIGKTTGLAVARSFFGSAKEEQTVTWNFTKNGFEDLAAEFNDSLLPLDDTSQLEGPAKDAAQLITAITYMTAGRTAKNRSKFYSTLPTATWRVFGLSTGESTIADFAKKCGHRRQGGEHVRLIDLNADVDEKLGIFESLPEGFENSGQLVDHLQSACGQFHGTAFHRYVKEITADLDGTKQLIKGWVTEFEDTINDDDSTVTERRLAKTFALIFAAGMLAKRFGVFPWTSGVIRRAIKACYADAYRQFLGSTFKPETEFERLRKRLTKPGRILDLGSSSAHGGRARKHAYAFIKEDQKSNRRFVAIKPRRIEGWIKNAVDRRLFLAYLDGQAWLIRQANSPKFTKQVRISTIGQKRRRYYCIWADALDV